MKDMLGTFQKWAESNIQKDNGAILVKWVRRGDYKGPVPRGWAWEEKQSLDPAE